MSERDEIMSTLVKAVDTTNTPDFNTGTVSNPTENTVLRLMEYNDRTNAAIDSLINLKIQIADEINQLEKENHQMVLKQRYLHCKKFEQIAVDTNYDYSWIIKLHGRALKDFECTFPEKFKESPKSH